MHTIDEKGLDSLLSALRDLGYRTIGPTLRNKTIVYDIITDTRDLPRGWIDEHDAGSYSLQQHADETLFGCLNGSHSWKQFLFPPRKQLFSITKKDKDFSVSNSQGNGTPVSPYAFVGVRACDLKAIFLHDKIFGGGEFADGSYASQRREAFIVAVNCTRSSENCFCVSMRTGPKAEAGFDLALTEIASDGEHYFLLEVGSDKGKAILGKIPHHPATPDQQHQADNMVLATAQQMVKSLDTTNIKQMLQENLEHPAWDDVAKRCLSCTNCTMVCPTCFCSTVEDTTDLMGDRAERWRRWDSCFTLDFARVAGGNFRTSAKSRYRQWLTHKLASWEDQFGELGCVGCGRCITWCPVGIDLTHEARAIRGEGRTTKSTVTS